MTIQQWLDSKDRDYDTGVKLYAAHPSHLRMLVVNLQRKQTKQMEDKLAYVLEKALAADGDGSADTLKKKGKRGAKAKKAVTKKPTSPPEMTEKPTPEEQTPPPMGEQAAPETPEMPSEEEE